MSQVIQKIISGRIQSLCVINSKKVGIKFIRLFCYNPENFNKNVSKRPMYAPDEPAKIEYTTENPVSNEQESETSKLYCTNPQCDLENTNYITINTNPEYILGHPDIEETNVTLHASIDNPPTTCCMSGCSNCVFIAWAEALSKEMATADPKVAAKILESVEDPSMKSFLQMELRNLGKVK